MKKPAATPSPPAPACEPADHGAPRARPTRVSSAAFERAAAIFRAAGDVPRLRLLEKLMHGEWCVTELAESLREGLSTVSQRLRLLRAEGLVKRRREGAHVYYVLADQHVAELIANTLAHADEDRRHAADEPDDADA
jgi:DNA-binding transcriptional ArsR family regulator